MKNQVDLSKHSRLLSQMDPAVRAHLYERPVIRGMYKEAASPAEEAAAKAGAVASAASASKAPTDFLHSQAMTDYGDIGMGAIAGGSLGALFSDDPILGGLGGAALGALIGFLAKQFGMSPTAMLQKAKADPSIVSKAAAAKPELVEQAKKVEATQMASTPPAVSTPPAGATPPASISKPAPASAPSIGQQAAKAVGLSGPLTEAQKAEQTPEVDFDKIPGQLNNGPLGAPRVGAPTPPVSPLAQYLNGSKAFKEDAPKTAAPTAAHQTPAVKPVADALNPAKTLPGAKV